MLFKKPNIWESNAYTKHRSLLVRWLPLIALSFVGLTEALFIALALSSLFKTSSPKEQPLKLYMAGRLYNSEPCTRNLHLNGYRISLKAPVDNQAKYYGESICKGRTVQDVGMLYGRTTMEEIRSKIKFDLTGYGANWDNRSSQKELKISTTVDVFYPEVSGTGWMRTCARVRLHMDASLNDSILVSKKYESNYSSFGLDKVFEGRGILPSLDKDADVTLGITLRQTLDQFYSDLSKTLPNLEAGKFKNVFFKVGSTDFVEGSDVILDKAVDLLRFNREMEIELDGFADNQGDLLKDKVLSEDRARTVKSYLVHHGIHSRRIKTKGFGATRMVSTNGSEESHKLNRRVEFVIIKI
jgi:outer membrane protein OmpA-like peptidoglycan-associated protein